MPFLLMLEHSDEVFPYAPKDSYIMLYDGKNPMFNGEVEKSLRFHVRAEHQQCQYRCAAWRVQGLATGWNSCNLKNEAGTWALFACKRGIPHRKSFQGGPLPCERPAGAPV